MKRSSHIRLSLTTPGSLDKAIQALKDYQKDIQEKSKLFVDKLGAYGLEVLNINISKIPSSSDGKDISTSLRRNGDGYTATLTISGDEVAFIEFGAGVKYNTSKGGSLHPKGQELGLTIGSYNPRSKNAERPTGWFYIDAYGRKQHTYGTPTYAPLHNSEMAIISTINLIAREVFSQ